MTFVSILSLRPHLDQISTSFTNNQMYSVQRNDGSRTDCLDVCMLKMFQTKGKAFDRTHCCHVQRIQQISPLTLSVTYTTYETPFWISSVHISE
jgi:hypothetical protein